jgi:hypothetical protein
MALTITPAGRVNAPITWPVGPINTQDHALGRVPPSPSTSCSALSAGAPVATHIPRIGREALPADLTPDRCRVARY